MKKIQDLLHHLFIPKEKNNYRAKALHHDFLTAYLVFALVVTVLFKQIQTETGNVLGYATDITTQKLYELTNKERGKAGLPTLAYNEKLSEAAKLKAENMLENNYWSHYGTNGESPWQFILGAGYEYEYAGENLAKNFLFSNGVVEAWMNSPSHKENIMRKEYKDIGFAVVSGVLNGEETTLVVQMFGTPSTSVARAPEEKQEIIQDPALNTQDQIVD